MNCQLSSNLLFAAVLLLAGTACASQTLQTPGNHCAQVNSSIAEAAAQGGADEASRILSSATATGGTGLDAHCAGLLSNNVAALFLTSGRLNEAQRFAEKAIAYLQKDHPLDDSTYLRPLHVLATVDLELGLTRKADELVQRMRTIPAITTADRALVDQISGAVLQREGRLQEAESQYRAVLAELSRTDKDAGAEGAAVRGQLACLYLQDHRDADALKTADDALRCLDALSGVPPLYRIKLLNVRAVACTRLDRWPEAEADLAEAVSLGRLQTHLDSAELQPIVSNYAGVLRKLHRKEARSVEKLAASLQKENRASSTIVDISQLPLHRRQRHPSR